MVKFLVHESSDTDGVATEDIKVYQNLWDIDAKTAK